MNLFVCTGNLGRDCETRVAGQTTLCTFSVAVKTGYGQKETTTWVRCNLWGKRAEGKLPQYLVKGTQVAVSGEISLNEYQTKEGEQRANVELNVANLDLIGGNRQQEPAPPAPPVQESTGNDVPF